MITAINHITLSTTELIKSFNFYTNILGAKPLCRWDNGAYLELGGVWLCLNLKKEYKANPNPDYSHIAWSINQNEFEALSNKIIDSGAKIFQDNTSEGDSLYFCDPDGHKLEIHVGNWQERLAKKKMDIGSWKEVEFFV